MKALKFALFLAFVMVAAVSTVVFAAGPLPSSPTDPCAAQEAAVDQAHAAMKVTSVAASTRVAQATKADFKAKRQALKCCRSPKLASCTQ
jgi:hypothetical protein